MSTYCCEGFIKDIEVVKDKGVSFTLEPAAPYLFEKKADDGKAKRCLLLVDDLKNPAEAKVQDSNNKFVPPKPADLNTLLIAKASHMKVRVKVSFQPTPIPVEEFVVL